MKKQKFCYNINLNSLHYTYVLAFLIYIFFASLLFKYDKISLKSISIIMEMVGMIGLGIYVINKVVNKTRFDFYDFLICLLCGFGVISTIFAINKQVSLFGFIGRYEGLLQIFCYYMLFLNCKSIDTIKSKKTIINVILIIILIQSIYAILQFYDVKNIFGTEIIRNRYYSNGFQTNPNFFGSLMTIGFSISLSLYLFRNKFDFKYLILCSLLFMGILTSGTMSAFVAIFFLIVFMIALFVILRCDLKTTLIKCLIILSIFLVEYKVFSCKDNNYLTTQINKTANEISLAATGEVKDNFGTGRIYIWRNALSVVPKNFLTGVGIDNFYYAFGEKGLFDIKNGLSVDKAHNEYLQKLVTEGSLSLVAYLVMLGTIFIKSCIKIFKERKHTNYMFITLFLCFVSYSIQAFFNISVIPVAPFYYIVMGLLVSKFKEVKNEEN